MGVREREKERAIFMCQTTVEGWKGRLCPASLPSLSQQSHLISFFVNHDSEQMCCADQTFEKERRRGCNYRTMGGWRVGGEPGSTHLISCFKHKLLQDTHARTLLIRKISERGLWVQKVYSEETLMTQCWKTLKKYIYIYTYKMKQKKFFFSSLNIPWCKRKY